MTKIYLFPGQGSQKKGMGAELFDLFPAYVQEAESILGYDLRKLCLEDPEGLLNKTDYTQPALYTINALGYFKKLKEGGQPAAVAGHSLGEYNALLAAGAFDFGTGLRLVKRRGAMMAIQSGGGMAAVIGLADDKIQEVIRAHGLQIDVANYNSEGQIVVSGLKADIDRCEELFAAAGARMVMTLPVSGAFHSRFMKPAGEEFERFLEGFQFEKLQIPVVANVTALPYADEDVKKNLSAQISGSVRWIETIQYFLELPEPSFEEVGPGQVLTGLLKRIKKKQLS